MKPKLLFCAACNIATVHHYAPSLKMWVCWCGRERGEPLDTEAEA